MQQKTSPLYLVSACLCGIACRYDGRSTGVEKLVRLCDAGLGLAVCPEVAGGLLVPRAPCELQFGRAVTGAGLDCTPEYQKGAQYALELAQRHGITRAILKEKSPSCGSSLIYDGTFNRNLIEGEGLTTAWLRRHGIMVFSENDLAMLDTVDNS